MTNDGDDDLREALRSAHRDEPPDFNRLRRRAPRKVRMIWALPAVAAAACAALVLLALPRTTERWLGADAAVPPAAELVDYRVVVDAPLDFLLDMPGRDLLSQTPAFDTKGTW
jgi:hypothetical protein